MGKTGLKCLKKLQKPLRALEAGAVGLSGAGAQPEGLSKGSEVARQRGGRLLKTGRGAQRGRVRWCGIRAGKFQSGQPAGASCAGKSGREG